MYGNYQDDNEPRFILEPEQPEAPHSPLKTCFVLTITIMLILSLLSSGLAGIFWLLAQRTAVSPSLATPTPNTITAEGDTPAIEPPPANTTVAATNNDLSINRIVYITPEGQLATIDPEGNTPRQLTRSDALFQFPAWSPDGNYIAAIGSDDGSGNISLLQDNSEQDAPTTIYTSATQNPFYLYWAPNSQYISFLANHPRDEIGLHLAAVDTAVESRLIATGSPFYWIWGSDSSEILAHIGFSGASAFLTFINTNNEATVSLDTTDNLASPGFFQSPGISSDNRFWAYAEEANPGESWLTITEPDATPVHRERHAGQMALGWSPNANQLAFITGRPESASFFGPLRLWDSEAGEVRLLSQSVVMAFFWSPDGRYIATITPGSANQEGLPNSGTNASIPNRNRISKPAAQFADFRLNLFVIDLITGQERQLTSFQPTLTFLGQFMPFFDQYALSHRLWSPDSQALVLPMRADGRDQLFVVPIDGTTPQAIADGRMPFWSQQ